MFISNTFGASADNLIQVLEASDCASHTTTARRGRWMLPPLQLLTSVAVLLARRIERVNR